MKLPALPGVSAVLVTRGDVDLAPICQNLNVFDEVVIWNNNPLNNHAPELAARAERAANVADVVWANTENRDLLVYGRYAALRACRNPIAYVQDDDCVLDSDAIAALVDAYQPGYVVCNMPIRFRLHYTDSALVGFGAVFDVGLPQAAFEQLLPLLKDGGEVIPGSEAASWFFRCCDVPFTVLTPRVITEVAYENRPYATDENRMYRQPDHVGERARMLQLAREVRDA